MADSDRAQRWAEKQDWKPQRVVFVVTLTTHKAVEAYPCRSMEKAVALANRFIASVLQDVQRPTENAPKTKPQRNNVRARNLEPVAA